MEAILPDVSFGVKSLTLRSETIIGLFVVGQTAQNMPDQGTQPLARQGRCEFGFCADTYLCSTDIRISRILSTVDGKTLL